jgi:hypothetical protein
MIKHDIYSLAEKLAGNKSHIVVLRDTEAYLVEGDDIVCCINDDHGDFHIHYGDNTDCGTYDEVMSEVEADLMHVADHYPL